MAFLDFSNGFAPVQRVSKGVSKKIKLLNLIGIFMVVYTHMFNQQPRTLQPSSRPHQNEAAGNKTPESGNTTAANTTTTPAPGQCDAVVVTQHFLAGGFLRCAVPLFFMFSGYFFFMHKADDLPRGNFHFLRRIRTRVSSVLLPFILWNMLAILLIIMVTKSKVYEANWPFFSYVNDWDLLQCIYKPFWEFPVAFQLWYLRDLFLIVTFFAPVYYGMHCLHRRLLWLAPIATVIPWMLHMWPLQDWNLGRKGWSPDRYWLDLDGLMFFPIGGILALNNVNLERKSPRWLTAIFWLLWVGIAALHTGFAACGSASDRTLTFLYKASIPFGVLGTWFGYDVVADWCSSAPIKGGGSADASHARAHSNRSNNMPLVEAAGGGTVYDGDNDAQDDVALLGAEETGAAETGAATAAAEAAGGSSCCQRALAKAAQALEWASNYSLWIYCLHEPMMGGIQENLLVAAKAYPNRQGTFMALFILFPLLYIPLLLLLAVAVQRWLPSIYNVLTGGRAAPAKKKS